MTKEQLRKEISRLREQLDAIEKRETEAEVERLVGKFFKYRNCYSCPQTDADYWWLYGAVVRRDGEIVCLEFQTDKYGMFKFEVNPVFPGRLSGWHGSTKREFTSQLKKATNHLGTILAEVK